MNTLQLPQHDIDLDLDFVDNNIVIRLDMSSPTKFSFEDEYDIDVIAKVSEESNLPISEIILKGLFLELQELGKVISYENETYIKQQIENFCEYCALAPD